MDADINSLTAWATAAYEASINNISQAVTGKWKAPLPDMEVAESHRDLRSAGVIPQLRDAERDVAAPPAVIVNIMHQPVERHFAEETRELLQEGKSWQSPKYASIPLADPPLVVSTERADLEAQELAFEHAAHEAADHVTDSVVNAVEHLLSDRPRPKHRNLFTKVRKPTSAMQRRFPSWRSQDQCSAKVLPVADVRSL
jgi:hypothetical protein